MDSVVINLAEHQLGKRMTCVAYLVCREIVTTYTTVHVMSQYTYLIAARMLDPSTRSTHITDPRTRLSPSLSLRFRYVGLTSLYMAVMMSDGLDVVTVELELE